MNDQVWHRHTCDPQIDVNTADTPVSRLRVLKIAQAWIAGDTEALQAMDAELGDCPKCLRQAMSCAIGAWLKAFTALPGSPLMAIELDIAATEAEIQKN